MEFYIPIWLDLLFFCCYMLKLYDSVLHSNMVRFIIYFMENDFQLTCLFTFQYG